MLDTRTDTVECYVCKAESTHAVALNATEQGPGDLDTRPAETMRSTMPHWVQRCPSCGYCAPDISEGPPRAERVVRTNAYRALLDDPGRPALANAFLASSAVLESGAAFADAGWQAVYAAWACDDAGQVVAAVGCRERALELFENALSVRQPVVEEPGGAEALMADLLRRCGRFDEALARAEAGLAKSQHGELARALRLCATLAARRDTAAHSVAEAPPEAGSA